MARMTITTPGAYYKINVAGVGELIVKDDGNSNLTVLHPHTDSSGTKTVKVSTLTAYHADLEKYNKDFIYRTDGSSDKGQGDFFKAVEKASREALKNQDNVIALSAAKHGNESEAFKILGALIKVGSRDDSITLNTNHKDGTRRDVDATVSVAKDNSTGLYSITDDTQKNSLLACLEHSGTVVALKAQNVGPSSSGAGFEAVYDKSVSAGPLTVSGTLLDNVSLSVQPLRKGRSGDKTAQAMLTVNGKVVSLVLKPDSATPSTKFVIDEGGELEVGQDATGKKIKASDVFGAIVVKGGNVSLYQLASASETDLKPLTNEMAPRFEALGEGRAIISSTALKDLRKPGSDEKYDDDDRLMFIKKNGQIYVGVGKVDTDTLRVTYPGEYYELGNFVDSLAQKNRRTRTDMAADIKSPTDKYGAVDSNIRYSEAILTTAVAEDAESNDPKKNAMARESAGKRLDYLLEKKFAAPLSSINIANAPRTSIGGGANPDKPNNNINGLPAAQQPSSGNNTTPANPNNQGRDNKDDLIARLQEDNRAKDNALKEERDARAKAEAAAKGGHQPSNKTDADNKQPPAMKSEGVGGIIGSILLAFGIGKATGDAATGNSTVGNLVGAALALATYLMRDKPGVEQLIGAINSALSAPAKTQTVGA